MHGCEGTSLPKLLKLDFSRLVTSSGSSNWSTKSVTLWLSFAKPLDCSCLRSWPILGCGTRSRDLSNAARHLLAWTAWLRLVPVQALPDHLLLASLLDQVRSDSSVRPEGFEATMTIPHLGRAEAARSALGRRRICSFRSCWRGGHAA